MADSALGHAASPTVAPAFRASTSRDNNAKAALTSTKTVTTAKANSSNVRLLANNASLGVGGGSASSKSVAGTATKTPTACKKKKNKNDAVLSTGKVTNKTTATSSSSCKTKAAAATTLSPRHIEVIDLTSSPRAHSLVEKPISNRRLKREPQDYGYVEEDDQRRRANVSDEKKRRRSDRYDSSESSDRLVPLLLFCFFLSFFWWASSSSVIIICVCVFLTGIHQFLSVHHKQIHLCVRDIFGTTLPYPTSRLYLFLGALLSFSHQFDYMKRAKNMWRHWTKGRGEQYFFSLKVLFILVMWVAIGSKHRHTRSYWLIASFSVHRKYKQQSLKRDGARKRRKKKPWGVRE